ncbi:NAD-dependent epimerase/dehydratase family protein [Flavobacterium muglaense]|uniref:NAD-dependent epimerase/dehydratase family protein n=1 Tax=Flavobacterium muglaense TaxID=2764716 RepID=A0A923N2T0_9FLAO|nr:NAD-dependent epimerase/dehydratase family protein [Flavobacterium muglaense]MBC5838431.1 NAD-dependent epimerase/dehydratase family protein [Flavobacterium muglaense]MBC5845015.1 NAD-dependent epimerase/dehydratase family protein [Flavobacterium muglaense]
MVLVTGGTGLVGAHLLLDLTESKPLNGEKIRALYRDLNSIQKTKSLFDKYHKTNLFDSIEWVKGDIVDVPSLEVAFTGIEQVYHCAATISFDPKDENLLRKTNIEGTANVVNFCLEHKIKKLCYVSSISALGDLNENESIITEKTEWNPEKPHSDYAISKYGAEMEIWRGLQEGLGVIIVNPGVILGPGFLDQGSGLLLKKIKNGLPFYTKGITGFIAVTDVVKIMITLMQSDIKNKRFTLIATNMVFQDFLNIASDALHVKRPTIHASPVFMNLAWQADWLFSLVFRQKRKITKATAKASYSTNTYSNDKIKKELNYSFTDIKEYLNSTVSLIN